MTDNTADAPVDSADAAEPTPSTVERSPSPTRFVVLVTALFALVYAYFEWDAIRNVIELQAAINAQQEVLSTVTFDVPWGLVIAAIIVPVLVFVVALIAGRRHTLARRAVCLAVGLTVVACLMLSVYSLG